ncbi:MAG: hypothetical protein DLM53_12415 [Candidatus Eremiobacter antarcticus]|nr:MAG: hypothetical protein DLM53_12415 [Candidatus Eremiobacter sp. RRmetagenome_bin22]
MLAACSGRSSLTPPARPSAATAGHKTRQNATAPPLWTWPFEPAEAPEPEPSGVPGVACDPHYRWAIKTLADVAAPQVNLQPVTTTIAALRAVPPPTPFPLPSEYPTRISPFEFTTYQLTGVTVVEIYPAGSDQDHHVILQDGSGNQFIAESALTACASGTIVSAQMTTVRDFIDSQWDFSSGNPVFPNVIVTVTGVGFFDPYNGVPHPQSGAELHPLLSFMLGTPGPSVSPSASPSPSPSPSASPSSSPSPSPSPSKSPLPTPSPTFTTLTDTGSVHAIDIYGTAPPNLMVVISPGSPCPTIDAYGSHGGIKLGDEVVATGPASGCSYIEPAVISLATPTPTPTPTPTATPLTEVGTVKAIDIYGTSPPNRMVVISPGSPCPTIDAYGKHKKIHVGDTVSATGPNNGCTYIDPAAITKIQASPSPTPSG